MTLLAVNSKHPEPDIIARAVAILSNGGLVAFPTETVYGLGANAFDAAAVARIFEAKGRPAWNPVIAHVANETQARTLTPVWPESAVKLAAAFWPGPLTLVLPKRENVPYIVTAGLPAVGIRMPSHPVALALITALGAPIAAPSANRFTELSPTTALHVDASLGNRVELVLDGGPSDVGIESTVVDLTGAIPVLLRPGTIARSSLEDALGAPVALPSTSSDADDSARLSPGRVERHYSPRADVWLFDAADLDTVRSALTQRAQNSTDGAPTRVAALVIDWSLALPPDVRRVPMPRDSQGYARALYATLHELDAQGYAVVAIERPPNNAAWAGVLDRLTRASR